MAHVEVTPPSSSAARSSALRHALPVHAAVDDATYGRLDHADEIHRAGVAVAGVLAAAVHAVEQRFGLDLDTPWAVLATSRLSDAIRR